MQKNILEIHTDGGARGNPGPAACAFIVEEDGKLIHKESKFLRESTNNFAEYQGVTLALKWLAKNPRPVDEIVFYLDSELVVRQLNGLYKVKNRAIKEIFLEVNDLVNKVAQKIIFKHVPRTKNKFADILVNKELDKNG